MPIERPPIPLQTLIPAPTAGEPGYGMQAMERKSLNIASIIQTVLKHGGYSPLLP
jgi:hypothetical protein